MTEHERAKYVVDLLNNKIHENETILDEKSRAIIESLDNFYNSKGEAKDYADELSMLFIKNPFECVYSRFRNVISNRNGHCLSFINPDYVKSLSALSDKDAEYTLKKARSGVPRKFMEDCTNEFCEGAQIKKTDDK